MTDKDTDQITANLAAQSGLYEAALGIIARWATVALSKPPGELRAELAAIGDYAAKALDRGRAATASQRPEA